MDFPASFLSLAKRFLALEPEAISGGNLWRFVAHEACHDAGVSLIHAFSLLDLKPLHFWPFHDLNMAGAVCDSNHPSGLVRPFEYWIRFIQALSIRREFSEGDISPQIPAYVDTTFAATIGTLLQRSATADSFFYDSELLNRTELVTISARASAHLSGTLFRSPAKPPPEYPRAFAELSRAFKALALAADVLDAHSDAATKDPKSITPVSKAENLADSESIGTDWDDSVTQNEIGWLQQAFPVFSLAGKTTLQLMREHQIIQLAFHRSSPFLTNDDETRPAHPLQFWVSIAMAMCEQGEFLSEWGGDLTDEDNCYIPHEISIMLSHSMEDHAHPGACIHPESSPSSWLSRVSALTAAIIARWSAKACQTTDQAGLKVDESTFSVKWQGRELRLRNTRQFRLLQELARSQNRFVSFAELAERMGGHNSDDIRPIKCRLEQKLKSAGLSELADRIETENGHYGLFL